MERSTEETQQGNAMNWSYSVYCLIENGKRVRYIGITSQRPEQRLLQHYADATRKRTDHKTNWIRHCLAEGIPIEIRVVKSGLLREQAERSEVRLLRFFHKAFHLVNSHEGGSSGYAGLSVESREKHSESGRARYRDPVQRAKMLEHITAMRVSKERKRLANKKPLAEAGFIEFTGEQFDDGRGKIWRCLTDDTTPAVWLEIDGHIHRPRSYRGVLRLLARRLTSTP
jgi:predicted GIY-YIG superfamily endonuclease